LSSFSGLNANKELAEKLLYQDVAIKLRLGEIRSVNGLGKLAYQAVPGKEQKYLEYRYSVAGKLDTVRVRVRLFYDEGGAMSRHSVEIAQ
jgi:hypothetical protein